MKARLLLAMTLPILTTVACALPAMSQNYAKKLKKAKAIEVTYQSLYNGQKHGEMTLTIVGKQARLEAVSPAPDPHAVTDPHAIKDPEQVSYLDYDQCKSYRYATLPQGGSISCESPFTLDKGFTERGTEKVLGLNCKVLRTSVNSNTIDVWVTTDLPFSGTPQTYVGVPTGLVMRVVRNGSQVQEASAIKAIKAVDKIIPDSWGEKMDAADYQYTINHCAVITVPVFDQQTVCFNGAKLPDVLEDCKQYSCAGGSIILKKVKLPAYAKNRQIFAEVTQYSDGDAYDRTGSVFIIPTSKEKSFIDALRDLKSVPAFTSEGEDYHALVSTPSYDVPLELMRFFTGFGVRKFNHNKVKGQHWVDSVQYKTEITNIARTITGEAWIGAYIGNWDAKGHRVSLNLKYYPGDDDIEQSYDHAMPLFNTVNYMEQAGQPYPIFMRNDSLQVKFTLKEDAKNAVLYYLTTGHGGWGGGDEFNRKPNTILLDGNRVITFVPWRDDCGTYRNNSPCSGNFSNGLSSSDLSRSNWCPGTVTNPEYIYLGDVPAGDHTITVKIPQGAPEGGSNSYWCISGTLIY